MQNEQEPCGDLNEMKQKRSRWARVVAVGVLAGIGLSAEASLTAYTANSVNLVYDDDLGATGLTWMQDANLFKTQAAADVSLVNQIIGAAPTITDGLGSHTVTAGDFDISTGHMTWWGAQAWVGYLNSISFAGVTGWRLPQAKPVHGNSFNYNFSVDGTSDVGYNGTTVNPYASELAHMFYNELGNKGQYDTSGNQLQFGYGVTNSGPFTNLQNDAYWSGTEYVTDARYAGYFYAKYGRQTFDDKNFPLYGWAVRPGQVAAVPIPAAVWLMGSGLVGLLGWGRRKAVTLALG